MMDVLAVIIGLALTVLAWFFMTLVAAATGGEDTQEIAGLSAIIIAIICVGNIVYRIGWAVLLWVKAH